MLLTLPSPSLESNSIVYLFLVYKYVNDALPSPVITNSCFSGAVNPVYTLVSGVTLLSVVPYNSSTSVSSFLDFDIL